MEWVTAKRFWFSKKEMLWFACNGDLSDLIRDIPPNGRIVLETMCAMMSSKDIIDSAFWR